jgi:hypothetical protein
MNRSILIVICDFLLVSLLAFSTVDIEKVKNPSAERSLKFQIATNQVDAGKDLTAVMRLALDDERKSRERLVGELTRSRETANQQQTLLGEREKQLQGIQQELQTKEQQLQTKEQQAAQLQQQLQTKEQQTQQLQQQVQTKEQQAQQLAQQQMSLLQQYTAAQTNLMALNQQLQNSSTEALLSKERLAAMEAEAKKQSEQAAALQQQLNQLSQSNQLVMNEKLRLASQLQVAEVETKHATEQAHQMQEEVKVERAEKAKLAEGVNALASHSSELTHEIRDNRPLAPNTIFNEFLTNRVQARFAGARTGMLGNETIKSKETETILASDGTNIFALCHVQDTPLTFFNPGTEWGSLAGTLSRSVASFPMRSLSFSWPDPRVVLIPVTRAEAQKLACKIFKVSADPFKFQDAVLVGAREGYYGECRFQIEPQTPEYVKLDNSFIKGLFGKFNPSRGDLVFSKTGELLGIMANNNYCMVLRSFDATATFQLGGDVKGQHTADTLARLYTFVAGLPSKLQ